MKTIPSSFTQYELSPTDTITGTILTSLNIAVIQNMRATIAEQKLNLEFTPNDVLSYTQQEAFLKGQLDILQHLIDSSFESQQAALLAAQSQAQSSNPQ